MKGAPVKVWALDCPPCEDYLRSDPHWASTISKIPETHDEEIARKDFAERGAMDRDQVLALALAKLAGVELPESLRQTISGGLAHVQGAVECGQGHENRAGVKFCAECGEAMRSAPSSVECPAGHPNEASAKFCGECGQGLGLVPALPAAPGSGPADDTAAPASRKPRPSRAKAAA